MFEKGNNHGKGRKAGSKNRLTNDVRQVFHKVYDEMGADERDEKTGEPLTGHQAMLKWAQENKTEFYRLYGKMIPATAELPEDMHEDFVATLIFEDEEAELIETNAKDVGNEGQLQLPSGETVPDSTPPVSDNPNNDDNNT